MPTSIKSGDKIASLVMDNGETSNNGWNFSITGGADAVLFQIMGVPQALHSATHLPPRTAPRLVQITCQKSGEIDIVKTVPVIITDRGVFGSSNNYVKVNIGYLPDWNNDFEIAVGYRHNGPHNNAGTFYLFSIGDTSIVSYNGDIRVYGSGEGGDGRLATGVIPNDSAWREFRLGKDTATANEYYVRINEGAKIYTTGKITSWPNNALEELRFVGPRTGAGSSGSNIILSNARVEISGVSYVSEELELGIVDTVNLSVIGSPSFNNA